MSMLRLLALWLYRINVRNDFQSIRNTLPFTLRNMHAEEIDGDGVIGLYPHLAPEDERVRVLKDV